jgi:hypothetical protein
MYFIIKKSVGLTFSFSPHYAESSNISKQKDYNPFSGVEPKEIPNTPNCNLTLSAYLIPSQYSHFVIGSL